MAVETFAAIDVGSYELAMKIFEISKKGSVKEIDHIRQRVDLGSDTYLTSKISYKNMDELCRVLREFTRIMKSYHVEKYRAYGTSAIRETRNTPIVLDQIRQRSGLTIGVVSNSEQRFLDYKAVALKTKNFEHLIEEGAMILDIGGGSLQISLFEEGKLLTTQNMKLGVLRIAEQLEEMRPKSNQVEELLEEMLWHQLDSFRLLYLGERKIAHVIVIDDYVSQILQKKFAYYNQDGVSITGKQSIEEFKEFYAGLRSRTNEEIAGMLGIPEENAPLLSVAAMIVREVAKMSGAKDIYTPGVTLCDGIAYEYAQSHRLIPETHDFAKDILSLTENISQRYCGNAYHSAQLETIALQIFDHMKKMHGMGERERLLLQIAVRLHDIGKYVSLALLGESSYSIILATEIIGISHEEREIVASVVKYMHLEYEYAHEAQGMRSAQVTSELTIAKLTAILRLANALDRSHKQKIKTMKVTLKEKKLILEVEAMQDIMLEKSHVEKCSAFFGEIYAIQPVVTIKK